MKPSDALDTRTCSSSILLTPKPSKASLNLTNGSKKKERDVLNSKKNSNANLSFTAFPYGSPNQKITKMKSEVNFDKIKIQEFKSFDIEEKPTKRRNKVGFGNTHNKI